MKRHSRTIIANVPFLVAFAVLFLIASAAQGDETPDSTTTVADRRPVNVSIGEAVDTELTRPISLSWSMTFATKYLFQGLDYSAGKPVINPEFGVAAKGFEAAVWINHDLHESVSNEYDLSFQYGRDVGNLSVAVGYMYLRYPHRVGWDPSQEMFADLGVTAPLSPSLSMHYDFDAGNGSYNTLGISHPLETPIETVSVGANLFYQDNYYAATGVPAFEVNANAEYPLGPFSITPSVSRFMTWENGDFRGEAAVPSSWYFSLGIGHSL